MRAFAHLLDRLSLTSSRNAKLTLVRDYLRETPDPERGWALAALTGELSFDAAKPAIDPQGGGGADGLRCCSPGPTTMSATWPRPWPWSGRRRPGANREPELSEVVDALRGAVAGRGSAA